MFGEDVAEAEESFAEVIVGACEVEDCEADGIKRGGGDGCCSGCNRYRRELQEDLGVRERLLSSFRRMRARRDGKLFVRV